MDTHLTLTLYTLGDIAIFKAALDGVSMIFSPSTGLFAGSGGALGLGALAGLGLLIALTTMLFQGIMKQKMEVGELVVLVFAFVLMFVPTCRVQIEDYFDGSKAPTATDKVPIGIALPAALFSGVARGVTNATSTVFSTTDGGYYNNVMVPLRILNTLRKMPKAVHGVAAHLTTNLYNYSQRCVAGRATFNMSDWKKTAVGDPSSFVEKLTSYNPDGTGLVEYYGVDAPNGGVLIACRDMAAKLKTQTEEFKAASGGFEKLLNTTPGVPKPNPDGGTVKPLTVNDYTEAFANLTSGQAGDAMNFALFALFTPTVNSALYCAPNSSNRSDLAHCMAFASATQQWAEDSAAAGSFFQRIMFNGMNMLLFLFFCLSPVVAILMLCMGIRGFKIAGSYLLFGAWCQSWFVGAVIVNFYIQKQLQYELQMNGGVRNILVDTYPQFLDSVTLKIGLAGDMMSSIPLIMMAVMSGSVYGLTAIAQRMSGREHYNEKIGSPDMVQPAPLAQMTAPMGGVMGMNGMEAAGRMDLGSIGNSHQLSNAVARTRERAHTAAVQLQSTFKEDLTESWSHGQSGMRGKDFSEALRGANMQNTARLYELGESLAKNKNMTAEQQAKFVKKASAGLEVVGFGGGLGIEKGDIERLSKADQETIQQIQKDASGYSASLSKEMSSGNIAQFVSKAEKLSGFVKGKSLSQTQSDLDAYKEANSEQEAHTRAQAFLRQNSIVTISRNLSSDALSNLSTLHHTRMQSDSDYRRAHHDNQVFVNNSTGKYLGDLKEPATVITTMAMQDPVAFDKFAGQHLYGRNGLSMPQGRVEKLEVNTAEAEQVTGPSVSSASVIAGSTGGMAAASGEAGRGAQTVRTFYGDNSGNIRRDPVVATPPERVSDNQPTISRILEKQIVRKDPDSTLVKEQEADRRKKSQFSAQPMKFDTPDAKK